MTRRNSLLAVCLLIAAVAGAARWRNSFTPAAKQPEHPIPAASVASRLPMWLEPSASTPGQFVARGERHSITVAASGIQWNLDSKIVRMRLDNANPKATAQTANPLAGRVDRFQGRDRAGWSPNKARFGKVRYESIYQGIDLAVYNQGTRIEHDFIVAPQADPAQIRMTFEGADDLKLDKDGSLVAQAGNQELRHVKPIVYQQKDGVRVEVAAEYKLNGNQAAFELGAYDHSAELIIDPVLLYSSYLGGSNAELPTGIAIAADGTYWITGTTASSSDFPLVGELPRGTGTGLGDIFVAHISPFNVGAESVLYAAFIGGSGRDEARGVAIEPSGIVAIAGSTASADFPIVGSYDSELTGGRDAVIIRVDDRRSGSDALVYTTFLGGDSEEYANAIAVDSAGQLYVTGYTSSENFPVTADPIQAVRQGGYETFISRINPDAGSGGLTWSTYYGGSSTDVATAIAVDNQGRIYVGGYTHSSNFPTGNDPFQGEYNGSADGFLVRVDPSRSGLNAIDRGTFLGGSGIDFIYAIHLGANEVVHVTGYTTSDNFPMAGNAPRTRFGGIADAFVARIDHRIPGPGQLTFSTYWGGAGTDIAYGIAVETGGRVHITGYTYSFEFPVTPNALQSRFGGGAYDAFIASFNPALPASEAAIYSSYWGGEGLESGAAITTDNNCNIHVTGSTTDSRMQLQNAFQPGNNGIPDAFMATLNVCQ